MIIKHLFKTLFAVVAICMLLPLTANAQDIEINAENFPDYNFRNWLLEQGYGSDGVITEEEINRITNINVREKNISSLKGIEHFTALETLICRDNQLTSLDVSHNPALTWLDCYVNQLTSLDVSQNPALETFSCSGNQLTSLVVSNKPALRTLYCTNNQLTNLDVSNNPALETFSCRRNQLTSLDVSQNPALTSLDCSENQLTSLNVSCNPDLHYLYCYNNQIKGEGMDALISSLPQNMRDWENSLYVYSDSYNEGNVCTKKQVAAAKAKGWISYYSNLEGGREYEGSDDTDYDEITLSDTGMGTYCSSNDLDFTHVDGLKAYIASGYDRATGTVLLTRVTEVPAGTGIILMGNEGIHEVPNCSEPSQYYYVSLLKGTLAEQELPTTENGYTNYILTKGDDGVMRFYLSSGGTIAAHKAYLQIPTSEAGSRSILGYTFDDDLSTAIKHPKHPARQQGDTLYNLNGQRIGQPRKGIYIQGGKKVIIH